MKEWLKEWRAFVVASAAIFIVGYSARFGAFLSGYLTTVGDYFSVVLALIPSLAFAMGLLLLALIALYYLAHAIGVIATLISWIPHKQTRDLVGVVATLAGYFYAVAVMSPSVLAEQEESWLTQAYRALVTPAWAVGDQILRIIIQAYERVGGYANLQPNDFVVAQSALGFEYQWAVLLVILAPAVSAFSEALGRWSKRQIEKRTAKAAPPAADPPATPAKATQATTAADDDVAPLETQAEGAQADLATAAPTTPTAAKKKGGNGWLTRMIVGVSLIIFVLYWGELKAKLDTFARQEVGICVGGQRVEARPILNTERGLVYSDRTRAIVLTPWSEIDETRTSVAGVTAPRCAGAPPPTPPPTP